MTAGVGHGVPRFANDRKTSYHMPFPPLRGGSVVQKMRQPMHRSPVTLSDGSRPRRGLASEGVEGSPRDAHRPQADPAGAAAVRRPRRRVLRTGTGLLSGGDGSRPRVGGEPERGQGWGIRCAHHDERVRRESLPSLAPHPCGRRVELRRGAWRFCQASMPSTMGRDAQRRAGVNPATGPDVVAPYSQASGTTQAGGSQTRLPVGGVLPEEREGEGDAGNHRDHGAGDVPAPPELA